MNIRRLLILLYIFCSLATIANDNIRVGIVTCYPGSEIYELEGHTALHLQGEIYGMPVNIAVNYGLFDFNSPNFVYRFVKGETDYLCGAVPWDRFLESYIQQGRRVIEHPVVLDSIQAERLVSLLQTNLMPENRVYRYNYVKDNCATRPLRIIERAIGDTIMLLPPTGEDAQDSTFRDVMRRYHRNYPWYQFGIDLALGSGIDYPITQREKTFAPIVLDKQLPEATVKGRRLTGDPVIIFQGNEDSTLAPTPWYATPLAVGWALFVLMLIASIHDQRHRSVSKWVDAMLFGIYGVVGIVITFLIFVSEHEATSPNWLYLWLNPLCLTIPALIWLKKCKKAVISYHFINFALILLLIVVWPLTGQRGNAAFVPLIGCDLMRSANAIIIYFRNKK